MPVNAAALGLEIAPRDSHIDTRRLLAYAAGIEQTFPGCFDDLGRMSGAPQFCVSLEWPLVNNVRSDGLLNLTPDETIRGVHVIQDSYFHNPIRPGDNVVTTGQIAEIRPARAGAFVRYRLQTHRKSDGETLVTSHNSSIFRDVGITGEGGKLDAHAPPPDIPLSEADAQNEIWIAKALPHIYSECADIWNPIHTERRVAMAAGLPDIILHGTATWALAGRELIRLYGNSEPLSLRRLHGRFTGHVLPDTGVVLRHRRADNLVHYQIINHAGRIALRDGIAEFSEIH